jgi:hypothetical protein
MTVDRSCAGRKTWAACEAGYLDWHVAPRERSIPMTFRADVLHRVTPITHKCANRGDPVSGSRIPLSAACLLG